MLIRITDSESIKTAQKLLEQRLHETLTQKEGSYTLGFQGDNVKRDNLYADHSIWFVPKVLDNKSYGNAFGLASKLNIKGSNNIVVEINIPQDGLNKQFQGLFAKDSTTGNTILLHRGKIGGGKKDVGKIEFLKWYNQETIQVHSKDSKNEVDDVLLIADLNSPDIATQIGKFVMSVADFKQNK